ncbi:MAG: calcium/sodium antiporter [Candidatus Gracilibacteria bacterium]|nr:calcium/sodium antiporter [Candidatus Gracilibacteria bacterium]
MVYILFLIGFVILIKGADLLVSGASSIALKFKIPAIVVGLTIVAFGTSTPELAVNMFSAIDGKTDLAIGNILGSNIANILLILGISAIIYPLKAQKSTIFKEIPFALLGLIILFVMANDVMLDGGSSNIVSRTDGFVYLGYFLIFLFYTFGIAKNTPHSSDGDEDIKEIALGKSIIFIIVGLIGLTLGGKWIVDGAVEIATKFGMSESVIGLTVVAIGTSLPELATSVVAAMKKQTDIAIGNVVGSNIFNVFWILGLTATISPLPFNSTSNIDVFMSIFATLILFLIMFIGKKSIIEKWQGICMIIMYIAYIGYLVLSNI